LKQGNPLSGHRFLIIEDEVMQALQLADMLAELGGTVTKTAYSADEAGSTVDDVPFDCALVDINLGGTLSFSIVDDLRRKGIPFVICTAYADAVDVHPGAWAAPRLDKPINLPALQEAVLEAFRSVPVGADQ
jgi:CheY-like chemotaxis protein